MLQIQLYSLQAVQIIHRAQYRNSLHLIFIHLVFIDISYRQAYACTFFRPAALGNLMRAYFSNFSSNGDTQLPFSSIRLALSGLSAQA